MEFVSSSGHNSNSNNRVKNATRIFLSSTINTIIVSILSFVSRTVFIKILGNSYLGLNGLFTNILSIISFAELGIGSAITFSLYAPLANNDTKKIQALMNYYKKLYSIVAIVVLILGLIIVPFLKYIINGIENVENITLIYLLFLINTVSSYLITYKSTLLSADQKENIINNNNTIFKIIIVIFQIFALIIYKNYIIYLIIEFFVQFISKIYLNIKIKKIYPKIIVKNQNMLNKEEKNIITTKIKALVFHKIGEVVIYQTDNILTSIFISTQVVGLVSNFLLIINLVNKFISGFFNSAISGLGNIIAVESKSKQFEISKVYDFLSFCFFGWSTLCLYFLLSPFVKMWIGPECLIDKVTIFFLCINYYFTGMRLALSNVKNAAGAYEKDKFVPLIQALINIIVSVILAKYIGLKGIYIGTFVSSIVPNVVRPIVVYKYIFEKKSFIYFKEYFFRLIIMTVLILLFTLFFANINFTIQFLEIIVKFLFISIFFLCIVVIFYKNTTEFVYLKKISKRVLYRKGKK